MKSVKGGESVKIYNTFSNYLHSNHSAIHVCIIHKIFPDNICHGSYFALVHACVGMAKKYDLVYFFSSRVIGEPLTHFFFFFILAIFFSHDASVNISNSKGNYLFKDIRIAFRDIRSTSGGHVKLLVRIQPCSWPGGGKPKLLTRRTATVRC